MLHVPLPITPNLSDRFALILDGLCRVVAARSARDRAAAPMMVLLWGRLRRLAARFAALAARLQAGTLPMARAPSRDVAARPPSPNPRQRLPAGFAWLVRVAPEAAAFGGQLRQLLAEPEMAALLGAAPQAGRLLRPLCRMLAVEQIPETSHPPPPVGSAAPAPIPALPGIPPATPTRPRVRARAADPPASESLVTA